MEEKAQTRERIMNTEFNVKDYGAVGDGATKDTSALQRAIDQCAAAGGGRVLLPAGTYKSGTIYLRSHVEFHLSSGATLLGSPDREDYNDDNIFPENGASVVDYTTGAHLIIAYCLDHVAITGLGTIDGHSASFFGALPEEVTATYRYKNGNYPILSWRPSQMVYFCRCKRVTVRDVALLNSPYWTLLLLGCEDVQLHGLTIINPPATRNGDGIDIDCSRNVTVSDCIIRSGDDCITLRANKARLGEHALPCENVAVTNCTLSTPCSAIRVGVGLGEIRNCTFSNIVVTETRTAISFNASYSVRSHGACIEQIHFSDFIVDAINPIVVASGPGAAPPAAIRDISFNRFRITASAGSQLTGKPDVPLERIQLTDFDWLIRGGTDNCAFVTEIPDELWIGGYQGVDGAPALPCALYGVFVHDLELTNIRVRWEQPSAVWRDGVYMERSREIAVRGALLRQPQEEGGSALHFRDTEGVTLQGCRAASGTGTFLLVEESPPEVVVRCIGNDWSEAGRPFIVDADVLEAGNARRI